MPSPQNIEYKFSWHYEYLDWICGFAMPANLKQQFSATSIYKIGAESGERGQLRIKR